jgi:hypothetical protein
MPLLLVLAVGCAGNAYLPSKPGGAANDLSGPPDRSAWLAEHPETPEDVASAIHEGVFIEGMTIEHRNVITNPDRRNTMGNGYWRSRNLGEEIRYQWFVGDLREPFDDGRGRAICELVYTQDILRDVRYCTPEEAAAARKK